MMNKLVLLLFASLPVVADDAPSFADIKAKHQAFAEYTNGLENRVVTWSGTVLESNPRLLGGQYLIIDIDGDKKEDVHLLFGKDRETEIKAYQHGDKVEFESKLPLIPPIAISDLFFKLENPSIKKTTEGKDSPSEANDPSADEPIKPLEKDAVKAIKPNVKAWQPDSLVLKNKKLIMVLPQDSITEQIYMMVINAGVCGSVHIGEFRWEGVSEVHVLNRYSKQGYVFEGGYSECEELGRLTGNAAELRLLGMTRVY